MLEKHAVTGAFGFTGRYIASRLLEAGHEVITLTSSPERPNPFGGKVAVHPYEFDNPEGMAESLKGVKVLYNTYWVRFNHSSVEFADPVKNTRAIVEAAKLAGVSRIVHISIANANVNSKLSYYKSKAEAETLIRDSGIEYSIVRPAVLFGSEGILINNIAWTLRNFPVFFIFGKGEYHLCPVYVDDLAQLLVEQGEEAGNNVINAFGPEVFTYKELAKKLAEIIGVRRWMIPVPAWLGYLGSKTLNPLVRDVFVTREELEALTSDLLYIPGASPTCQTRFTDWAKENAANLGKKYSSELGRRRDKKKAY